MSDIPTTREPGPHGNEAPSRGGHSIGYWLIFLVAVLGVAAAVYLLAWLPRHNRQQELEKQTQQESHQTPKVRVLKVQTAPSANGLQVPGTTQAYTEAYVYARASGYVTRRLVDIGDHVRAGQLLATIDAPDLDKEVAQAQSALEQSRSSLAQLEAQLHLQELNWERYKVLVAKGVFSRQQGDQQEADYRVAEANVQAAQNAIQGNRDNLERIRVLQQYEQVTAPFSGVITVRNVDVGALINSGGSGLGSSSAGTSPATSQSGAIGNNSGSSGNLSSSVTPSTGGSQGGEMFAIATVDPLRILVSVPEAYAGLIRVGDRANLFFEEMPSDEYQGKVTRTSASIDPNTRTLLVEVQARNPRSRYMPGMYVVVNFLELKAQPPLLVPGETIVVRDGKNMIAVVDGQNTIHFRPIQIGRDFGNEVEVASGLRPGETVATIITDEIRDGVKIDPEFQKEQQQVAGGQNDRRPGEEGQYGNQGLSNQSGKAGKGSGSNKGNNK